MRSRSSTYIGEPHNLYWAALIGCEDSEGNNGYQATLSRSTARFRSAVADL